MQEFLSKDLKLLLIIGKFKNRGEIQGRYAFEKTQEMKLCDKFKIYEKIVTIWVCSIIGSFC